MFGKDATDDKFELEDLESALETLEPKAVPGNADDFLGLGATATTRAHGPLASLKNVGRGGLKDRLLHALARFLPGVEEVVTGKEEGERTRERLATEAAAIREGEVAAPSVGDEFELEQLLEPLIKPEIGELLDQEYGQETLFVQWERERHRNYFVSWAIAGFSAVLMLALALSHAGDFINHLLSPTMPLPHFLVQQFGVDFARGTVFVAGMLNALLAFLVFITSVTNLINSLMMRVVKGTILALEGFGGLLVWAHLMNSNNYFAALLSLAVLFVVMRVTERAGE